MTARPSFEIRAANGEESPVQRFFLGRSERLAIQEVGIFVQVTEVETSTAKVSKTAGGQASFTGLQIDQSRTCHRNEDRTRLTACADDDGDEAEADRNSAAERGNNVNSSMQLPSRACVHTCLSAEDEAVCFQKP